MVDPLILVPAVPTLDFVWRDDFLGDQLKDEWTLTASGGTATIIDGETGGIVRVTSGAIDGNFAQIDWGNIRSLHIDKKIIIEYRVKLSSIADVFAFLKIRFDPDEEYQLKYDSSNGDTKWMFLTENGASTEVSTNITPDTNYHIFRMEAHTHGGTHIHFYIDGVECANSPVSSNLPDDAGDFLQPNCGIQTRTNTNKLLDVDYVWVTQER